MASFGYPESYKIGYPIEGINQAEKQPHTLVYQAGTKKDGNLIVTSGGRVLNITAFGDTVKDANLRALSATGLIKWNNSYYRNDIGWKAIEREDNE